MKDIFFYYSLAQLKFGDLENPSQNSVFNLGRQHKYFPRRAQAAAVADCSRMILSLRTRRKCLNSLRKREIEIVASFAFDICKSCKSPGLVEQRIKILED